MLQGVYWCPPTLIIIIQQSGPNNKIRSTYSKTVKPIATTHLYIQEEMILFYDSFVHIV